MPSHAGNKIYAVIDRVFRDMQPTRTGPLLHIADIDGWRLRLNQGDDGTVILSARQDGGEDLGRRLLGYDCSRYDDHSDPEPVYRGTQDGDLELLADLADRGTWVDTLDRDKT